METPTSQEILWPLEAEKGKKTILPSSLQKEGSPADTLILTYLDPFWCFPRSSAAKESDYNPGDLGLIPGLGRSPGGGHGNPLKYSCPENFMDRGAWRATVHGVTQSRTQMSD